MLTKIHVNETNKTRYPILTDDNARINISEFNWFSSNIDDKNAQISFRYENHYILGYSKEKKHEKSM